MKDWVVIGKFGRQHGLHGLIRIYSFTHPLENFLTYEPKYAYINKKWQKISIADYKMLDKYILAKIKDFETREKVSTLTNIEIGIKSEQLATLGKNEFYWHQLIGLKVVNQESVLLGQIIEILPTGSNDVLIIKGDKRYLIPYLPEFVIDINLDNMLVKVDWDENHA